MPSPVGHALAGLATAWILTPAARPAAVGNRSPRVVTMLGGGLAVACGLLAMSPDLDVVIGSHRTVTHSLGAAFIVGVAASLVATRWHVPAIRTGAVCAIACATHVLLDWLGKDSAPPYGIMALWPASSTFYTSGADLFMEISRRYWKPDEFIVGNLRSLAWELLLLGPVAGAAWWVRMARRSGVPHG